MAVSRAQIVNELLPGLEKLFGMQYEKPRTEYVMRCRYSKYSIYRWDYSSGKRNSTTIATGLDRDTAKGMMKLLEEPK